MAASFEPGVERVEFDGEPAWRKSYGGSPRRWRLKALDLVARMLKVPALRPPPHPVGMSACATEARRLRELAAHGVRVPDVLEQGPSHLVLEDMGETLAGRLRRSAPDEAGEWFARAALAVAEAHRHGTYLGQPQARNLVVDASGQIGFLDFEEDPVQAMTLVDAQVRDWLVFMAGTARHIPQNEDELSELLAEPLAQVPPDTRARMRLTVPRLGFLGGLSWLRGSRAAGIGKAIRALHGALGLAMLALVLIGLGVDFLHDGDFEVIELIAPLLD